MSRSITPSLSLAARWNKSLSSVFLIYAIGGEFSPVLLILLGLLVEMAVAHPAGRDQLPSLVRLDRRMATLAVVAAIGAVVFAGIELSAHFSTGDVHAGFGHYLIMATAAVGAAALSLYAIFRGIGWRYPAYAAATLMALVGLGSVAYPGVEQGSSLRIGLGLVLVLWAALFVFAAEQNTNGTLSDCDSVSA